MFNQTLQALGYPARANTFDPLPGIGSVIHQTKCMAKLVYDFAVAGGATGSVALLDDQGAAFYLPVNAVVTNVAVYGITSLASSASGSFALQLLTTADIMASKTTIAAATWYAGVPTGATSGYVGPVTASQGSQINGVITVGALTAIKLQAFIEFVIVN